MEGQHAPPVLGSHAHTSPSRHLQGLLPFDMFATKLLTSPARMLALEPEQKVCMCVLHSCR